MDPVHPLPLERIETHLARSRVTFTNLQREAYPAIPGRGRLLKAHVLDYYLQVAPALLPHLRGRPLAFRRYPDGIRGPSFYTKDWRDDALPEAVRTVDVWSETRDAPLRYALVENEEALGWLAQNGSLEAHPWLARIGSHPDACATERGLAGAACGLDRPDLLAFDLDPYVRAGRTGTKGAEAGGEPGLDPADWARAVEAALHLRDLLRELRFPSFVKTSGKRGLHVYVPLVPEHAHSEVRAVARALCAHLARERPDLLTLEYDLARRKGRVFLDYNQNVRGKTLAAPYSLRPTPEATVSTPIAWDELEEADPAAFTFETVPERLRERGDPWRDLEASRRRLAALLAGGLDGAP